MQFYRKLVGLKVDPNEALKFVYVLKAWEKISTQGLIPENELLFDSFFSREISVKKLSDIFEKLANRFKLFKLYSLNSKIDDAFLVSVFNLLKDECDLPKINEIYLQLLINSEKGTASFVPFTELGMKLLGKGTELYVPFMHDLACVDFGDDKKIFAESTNKDLSLIAELINVLDGRDIEFHACDALIEPSYTNLNASHLLRQFDRVLSFPPMGARMRFNGISDKFNRFKFHSGLTLDVAYFEHILAQTSRKAVILMSNNFTFSSSSEAFRRYLIEQNLIEAVIALPNVALNTYADLTLFVVNKDKKNPQTLFVNLKNGDFSKKDGRKAVLTNINEIVKIVSNQKQIENISVLASYDEIMKNNYSLLISKYVISPEIAELQATLSKFELTKLEDVAYIRKSQLIKDEETGDEILEISSADFAPCGYSGERGRTKKISPHNKSLETYRLLPYDVLLSVRGIVGMVAIIGETPKTLLASQAVQVIRLKKKNAKEDAICLYMFLKSDLGQAILSSIVAGTFISQISTSEIKEIRIPIFTEKQRQKLLDNFTKEQELYAKINSINEKIKSINTLKETL